MLLKGKRGLVLNVTNDRSLGWAIAEAAHEHGAELLVGAQNEKLQQRLERLLDGQERMESCVIEFGNDEQLNALVEKTKSKFGKIDFLVHSAAFALKEDLDGRFIDTSREGFRVALDVSAYSLVELCRAFEPLFADDASVITLSYLGSQRAVGNYNVMGVAKAALESSVRYLSQDLGQNGVRVNTISPGPINTISARGVKGLADMIRYVQDKSPLKKEFGQQEVAGSAVYFLSDLSKGVTGQIVYVDSGYNIVGF